MDERRAIKALLRPVNGSGPPDRCGKTGVS
jgi:hypothetical protein